MKYFYFLIFLFIGFALNAQEYSQRYKLVNLGREVNTAYHEGAPVVSADGKTLYFFVHNHPQNTFGKEGSQDIWFSEKGDDGKWGKAQHLGKQINVHKANQVFTVLPDNETLFIRGGSSKNEEGFSFIHKQGEIWSKAEELDIEGFKKMHQGKFYGATMSTDRNFMILYFSEKPNSEFNDLYLSKNLGGDKWSRPEKLGTNINTGRDEFGPFLAPDDKTLYFSSTRKDMGFGYSDIYKTKRLDDTWTKWSNPENVGRPLNTRAYDAYFSIDTHKNVFTTQSGNTIDGGNLDIFSLQLKDIHINLKGLVLDQKSGEGIPSVHLTLSKDNKVIDTLMASDRGAFEATFSEGNGDFTVSASATDYLPGSASFSLGEIVKDTTIIQDVVLQPERKQVFLNGIVYNEKTDEPIQASLKVTQNDIDRSKNLSTSAEGFYEVELLKKGWYSINVKAEGFLSKEDSVNFNDEDQTLYEKNLYLEPIEVGTTVRLENIFFDFDKTTLKEESFIELDKVVDFLNDNSSIEIEIAGHTDSKGADDYNLNLSQGRAQAVVDYITSQGIDGFRLIAKGYGESVPVETNDTEEGRAVNRRVEFTVLKK